MAWCCHFLPSINIGMFNWAIIILLGFEIIYIALQASKGQESHFNVSTPLYAALFSLMAIAASVVTLYTLTSAFCFSLKNFLIYPTITCGQ